MDWLDLLSVHKSLRRNWFYVSTLCNLFVPIHSKSNETGLWNHLSLFYSPRFLNWKCPQMWLVCKLIVYLEVRESLPDKWTSFFSRLWNLCVTPDQVRTKEGHLIENLLFLSKRHCDFTTEHLGLAVWAAIQSRRGFLVPNLTSEQCIILCDISAFFRKIEMQVRFFPLCWRPPPYDIVEGQWGLTRWWWHWECVSWRGETSVYQRHATLVMDALLTFWKYPLSFFRSNPKWH